MKTKREKLKEVLQAMKGERIDFSAFDASVSNLRKSLEEKVAIPTLDKVNSEIEKFREKIDLAPLLDSLESVKKNVSAEILRLETELTSKLAEQTSAGQYAINQSEENVNKVLDADIASIRIQIASLDIVGKAELTRVETEIKKVAQDAKNLIDKLVIPPDRESEITALTDELEKVRLELLNRINNIGGGNMNRQVFFNSTDYLTKYTDINWKAGTNVTFTIANNNTTKKVDITVSASGGGGGTVRSINSISTDTTAGATAGTDYVYLVSGTTTLTLPTAVGNTNLYTIKNVGTGVVTIACFGAETIDATTTITMPVQYTAVDLISDTANWNVT